MDVQMPIMDGVTATRQIRKVDGPAHDIPVLALTANVMAQERERYLAAGMNECLMKPINWQELAAAIARYPVRAIKAPPIQRADEAATVDAAPLFRRALLDELGAGVLPLVKRALEDAEAACERIAALPPDSPELEREAHRLKGMSGSLGMMAISREAARLDDATRMGAATAPLVTCLREVTTATRVELQNEGLI
jgi:response regulator RpfG family c-di-GMP phosphodiesterase